MAADFLSGMFGGGGSGSKEFGSSTANTTFGAYSRGKDGGLAPEWLPYALVGVVLIVVILLIPRK